MIELKNLDDAGWFSDETATFGDRLAGARDALGLTQQDLAARLGVKLATVLDWENDLNDPRANKLQMLSGVLNVSMSWLLTGKGVGLEVPENSVPEDIESILDEMRQTRSEMSALVSRLAGLESRLKSALRA